MRGGSRLVDYCSGDKVQGKPAERGSIRPRPSCEAISRGKRRSDGNQIRGRLGGTVAQRFFMMMMVMQGSD